MVALRYEGRPTDADSAVAIKSWADTANTALTVTTGYVNSEISRVVALNDLQTTTYVDYQDSLLADASAVADADALYLSLTEKDVSVATLTSSGMLRSTQLPTLVTDRVAQMVEGTVSFSGTLTSLTTLDRDLLLASVTIDDPGYPYIPLPFGMVTAKAGGDANLTEEPWKGTGVTGRLLVAPPSGSGVADFIYGIGWCSDNPAYATYPVFPYGGTGVSPSTRPAQTGSLTLNLFGSSYQNTGYTFSSANLSFSVLVVPAVGP